MNAFTQPPLRKFHHPALQGLGEKALTAIFNAGVMRTLKEQDWLFHVGESAVADLLILEGSAGLYRQQQSGDALLLQAGAGESLPCTLLQLDGSYTYDCKAQQALTVLQLDMSALSQLEESAQLIVQRSLLASASRLFAQLGRSTSNQRGAASVDTQAVCSHLAARQTPYAGSTPLQTMLAGLPKLPPYTTKLTSLLNDPKASTRNIVEIARQDPSLTASVLKTVNSAYFGLTHKIKDFQHAVMMLGFTQMQQLLINTGVQSTMPNTPEFRQLQAHSMMISALCSEISLTLKAGSAPMLSTLGILHDIGKSVVLLLKRQNPKQEFLLGLLDPDVVGMMLLREWQIPELISEALQYQSWAELLPPDAVPAAHRESVGVLYLAHCSLERLRTLQTEAAPSTHCRQWLQKLGCRDGSLDEFLLGRLIPGINARTPALPLALQDMIRKAQLLEPKSTSTPP